jgi:hypothetical protein
MVAACRVGLPRQFSMRRGRSLAIIRKIFTPLLGFLWCVVFFSAVLPTSVLAQSSEEKGSKDQQLALPSAAVGEISALTVGSSQVAQFRRLLLPELFPLVRAGVIELEALARTRYDWKLRSGAEDAAAAAALQSRELAAEGEIPPAYRQEQPPLFDGKDKSGALNPTEILWNAAAARWSFPAATVSQTVSWYQQGKFHRELKLQSLRVYPAKIPGITAGIQLFRERVQLQSPEVLRGLAFLTYRFLGVDEDIIWSYAPAIAKARQLAGPSYADSILGTPLTLSDLDVWNGKHEVVEPSLQLTQEALVPVAGVDLLTATPGAPGCVDQQGMNTRAGSDLVSRWATEGRSAWSIFSSLSYFVPRQVVRIELESRDPFSEYGRQVLTIDQELQVPLMKLVYNRSGHPWKFVMGSLALVQSSADPRRIVRYPIILVHDYLKDETLLLSQSSGTFCDGFSAAIPETALDLRGFTGQAAAPTAEGKANSAPRG